MSIIGRRLLQKCTRHHSIKLYKPSISSRYYRINTKTICQYTHQYKTKPTMNPSPTITLSTRYTSSGDPRTKDYFNNYRENSIPTSLTSSTDFNPSNTSQVFQSFSTYALIKYNTMFSLLSIEPLVNIMIKIMIATVGTGTPREAEKKERKGPVPITLSNIASNKVSFVCIYHNF